VLTTPLIRVRVSRTHVRPQLVDPADDDLLARAQEVLDVFREGLEQHARRAEVDEGVNDVIGDERDAKLVRGLAKIVLDRCTFGVQAPFDPREVRAQLFAVAREVGPLALAPDPLDRPTAQTVLQAVAAALDTTPEVLDACMYADLEEEQRFEACELPLDAPSALLDRYNVALCQAVLLRATSVRIALEGPTPARARQLLRYVKFHRLIHVARREGATLVLELDGPASVLKQSTRYGMQLALLLPALALQECGWSLEAQVLWGPRKARRTLELTRAAGLCSHYADRGAYTPREHTHFQQRFGDDQDGWSLSTRTRPIDLGGQAVILPDFALRKDGQTVYLEILGFWRKDDLARRLELLERYGPGNLVLAISKRLRVDKGALDELPVAVVEYADVVPIKRVIEAANRLAPSA
jgi:predicted nuclease of restriction endonuclease-like RecB superfamily